MGKLVELEERERVGKERENGNTRGNRGTDVHQKGGRGKPLRLICLPAQLDYFLGDCRLALGSLQCPEQAPPAVSLRTPPEMRRNGMETPLGLGLQEISSVSLWQVLSGQCFEQNKPFDSLETDTIITHFADEKTEI